MRLGRRECLVLTMPPDPGLARVARLVSLHFFRQNGVRAPASRRQAGLVEARCRVLLRAPAGPRRRALASGGGPHLVMTLVSGHGALEVRIKRSDGSGRRCLLRLERDAES